MVFPGSVHPETGAVYEWAPGCSPDEIDLAPFPEWLVNQEHQKPSGREKADRPKRGVQSEGNRDLDGYLLAALNRETQLVSEAQEGQRNNRLNSAAFLIGRLEAHGMNRMLAEDGLVGAAMTAGLSETEARKTFASGWDAGTRNPRDTPKPRGPKPAIKALDADAPTSREEYEAEHLTELASARRLRKQHGNCLRHSKTLGWLVWDAKSWRRSEKAALRKAQAVGQIVRHEATQTREEGAARAHWKHAKRCESEAGAKAILWHARALEGIDADDIEWDAQPGLLNCLNGMVDLRTGELLPHDRTKYFTKVCPVDYDPAATAPRWREFLREVFDGDEGLVEYVQWACGYALTGDTSHDVFFILHGSGANGKTTFISTLQKVWGDDYSQQIDPEELMVQKFARHSTEMAALRGARLVAAVETQEGRRLNESLIKALTGGDKIRARFMRMDSFEFKPQLKLFMGTNHKPVIRDTSNGMWRRIRLIPFNVCFQGERRDPGLAGRLAGEAQGILAWAIAGAQRAARGEPSLPDVVKAATDSYREAEDTLHQFIEEACDQVAEARCPKRKFYQAYREWCGGCCPGERAVGERMTALGFRDGRMTGGCSAWFGLALKPE